MLPMIVFQLYNVYPKNTVTAFLLLLSVFGDPRDSFTYILHWHMYNHTITITYDKVS